MEANTNNSDCSIWMDEFNNSICSLKPKSSHWTEI